MVSIKFELWSLQQGRGYEEFSLVRCDSVYPDRNLPMFQTNVLPPSSRFDSYALSLPYTKLKSNFIISMKTGHGYKYWHII
jgi:hypothetical protein